MSNITNEPIENKNMAGLLTDLTWRDVLHELLRSEPGSKGAVISSRRIIIGKRTPEADASMVLPAWACDKTYCVTLTVKPADVKEETEEPKA